MTLARRLNRLGGHWPHPADVLASRLGAEFDADSPRTLEDSAALYRRCRALLDAAGLGDASTGRALSIAMVRGGFPEDGVRQCLADMPLFFVLTFACLGISQMAVMQDTPEMRRQFDAYLASVLSEDEQAQLHVLSEHLAATKQP